MKKTVLFIITSLIMTIMPVCADFTVPDADISVYREILKNAGSNPGSGSRSYVYSALCKLYTGKDVKRANELLVDEKIVSVSTKEEFEESPFQLYWSMPAYIKAYAMFNSENGKRTPGLLEPETEKQMEKVMWSFVQSYYEGLFTDNPLRVVDSENHDMLKKSSVYLAVQCLKDKPGYSVLPDGKMSDEFVEFAGDYFDRWFTERAKSGLLVEGSENYRTITLEGVYNIMDLAEKPILRNKAKMFADVLWIEYAVETLNGIRGGGKTRVYNRTGEADNGFLWFAMLGSIYFGMNEERNPSPIVSVLVSDYRPPRIAQKIIDSKSGSFEFIKMIPGCGVTETEGNIPVYTLDANKKVMSYQYITPEVIAGSLCEENPEELTLISSQNRWQGIIFKEGFNNRIYPYVDTTASTHNNFSVVQNGPVMLFKKNAEISFNTGIYISGFGGEINEQTLENGWLYGQFGDAYYGIKPLNGTIYSANGKVLLTESNSPFVIQTGSKEECGTFDTFKRRLQNNSFSMKGNNAVYRDSKWGEISLGQNSRSVNGKEPDYTPDFVMKSPFLKGEKGLFDVVCNGKRIIYDFNVGKVYEIPYIAERN